MLDFLNNIKDKDPVKPSWLEVVLCYPGVHALFFYRIANVLHKLGLPVVPRFISYAATIISGIEIHPAAKIGKRLFIDHGTGVVIGETAVIGDDVTIYHGVTLGSAGKITDAKRHPTIGNNVILGAGAKIIGNIIIGDEAKIGPNAVVHKNVAPKKVIIAAESKAISKEEFEIEYLI